MEDSIENLKHELARLKSEKEVEEDFIRRDRQRKELRRSIWQYRHAKLIKLEKVIINIAQKIKEMQKKQKQLNGKEKANKIIPNQEVKSKPKYMEIDTLSGEMNFIP